MNPEQPHPPIFTVRYDRTQGAWALAIGATMLFGLFLHHLMDDVRLSLLTAVPFLFLALLTYAGLSSLLRSGYLTHDPRTGRVEVRDFWRRWRSYPSPGYRRLAYTSSPVEVREVADDGESRRVPISHVPADSDDWAAFTERLFDIDAADR